MENKNVTKSLKSQIGQMADNQHVKIRGLGGYKGLPAKK